MFCIEPGGDPSLVLPFSPPAANWGPVELNANYNRPAALQNWLSMPGSSILGLMVLKGPTLCCVYPEMYFEVNHSVSITVDRFPASPACGASGLGTRLVLCVNVLRFVDIV